MDAGIRDQLELVGEDVWLTVPPFSEYLRTVRLVAADAAVRGGLDYDEVEDFRIAVDELCHLLMSSTDQELSVSFGVVGSSVMARGRARRRVGSPPTSLNELSRTIIASVADRYDVTEQDDELGFVVTKTCRGTPER
jgi:hypothetical protein